MISFKEYLEEENLRSYANKLEDINSYDSLINKIENVIKTFNKYDNFKKLGNRIIEILNKIKNSKKSIVTEDNEEELGTIVDKNLLNNIFGSFVKAQSDLSKAETNEEKTKIDNDIKIPNIKDVLKDNPEDEESEDEESEDEESEDEESEDEESEDEESEDVPQQISTGKNTQQVHDTLNAYIEAIKIDNSFNAENYTGNKLGNNFLTTDFIDDIYKLQEKNDKNIGSAIFVKLLKTILKKQDKNGSMFYNDKDGFKLDKSIYNSLNKDIQNCFIRSETSRKNKNDVNISSGFYIFNDEAQNDYSNILKALNTIDIFNNVEQPSGNLEDFLNINKINKLVEICKKITNETRNPSQLGPIFKEINNIGFGEKYKLPVEKEEINDKLNQDEIDKDAEAYDDEIKSEKEKKEAIAAKDTKIIKASIYRTMQEKNEFDNQINDFIDDFKQGKTPNSETLWDSIKQLAQKNFEEAKKTYLDIVNSIKDKANNSQEDNTSEDVQQESFLNSFEKAMLYNKTINEGLFTNLKNNIKANKALEKRVQKDRSKDEIEQTEEDLDNRFEDICNKHEVLIKKAADEIVKQSTGHYKTAEKFLDKKRELIRSVNALRGDLGRLGTAIASEAARYKVKYGSKEAIEKRDLDNAAKKAKENVENDKKQADLKALADNIQNKILSKDEKSNDLYYFIKILLAYVLTEAKDDQDLKQMFNGAITNFSNGKFYPDYITDQTYNKKNNQELDYFEEGKAKVYNNIKANGEFKTLDSLFKNFGIDTSKFDMKFCDMLKEKFNNMEEYYKKYTSYVNIAEQLYKEINTKIHNSVTTESLKKYAKSVLMELENVQIVNDSEADTTESNNNTNQVTNQNNNSNTSQIDSSGTNTNDSNTNNDNNSDANTTDSNTNNGAKQAVPKDDATIENVIGINNISDNTEKGFAFRQLTRTLMIGIKDDSGAINLFNGKIGFFGKPTAKQKIKSALFNQKPQAQAQATVTTANCDSTYGNGYNYKGDKTKKDKRQSETTYSYTTPNGIKVVRRVFN